MARVIIEKRIGQKRNMWRIRYGDPATGRLKTHRSFSRKADATSEAARVRVELERGTWFDDSRGRKMALDAWVDEWALRAQHRRVGTIERDALYLRLYWQPAFGEKVLPAITPYDVTGQVARLQSTYSAATVRTAVEVFSRVMRSAVDNQLIAINPVTAVRLRRAPQRSEDIRFLSATELQLLADSVRPNCRAAIWLGGAMGCRWSEVAGLRVGRVDLANGRLHIVETTTETVSHQLIEREEPKSSAGRRVLPMPPLVVDALRAHFEMRGYGDDPDQLILPAPTGGPATRGWFRKGVFGPGVKRAGLTGLTFHSLRHSCAGLLIVAGAHPEVIRLWLGHSDIRTTMRLYGRVTDETVTRSATAMQLLLTGEAGPAAAWRDGQPTT